MEKEVTIDEKFTLPMLFEEISKGDVYKIPFNKSLFGSIRTEASKRNSVAREMKLISRMESKFKVSKTAYQGFIAIMRIR